MSSDIDFAAFHHWPDNWLDNSTSFEISWVAKHIADAASLGKPVSCCISVVTFEIRHPDDHNKLLYYYYHY